MFNYSKTKFRSFPPPNIPLVNLISHKDKKERGDVLNFLIMFHCYFLFTDVMAKQDMYR